jgi:hypothetical protein
MTTIRRIISTLPEVALLAIQNGNPNPDVPADMTSKLVSCVSSGVNVLVLETEKFWLAVLRPRKEDEGLALAYAYEKNPEGAWEEEPLVIDHDLKSRAFFGGPILGLDQLAEVSEWLREWMNR